MWRRLLNSVENHFYPQKIKKAGKEEVETQVPGQMTDKWTMGLSNEGLYNGVSLPEEGDTRKKEETSRNNYCSIWKNTTYTKASYLRSYPSDLTRIH